MRRSADSTIDRGVFGISVLFVLWGVLFTDNLAVVAKTVLDYLIATYGWVFILATFGFLIFVGFLALSRYGRVRLGQDDDRPEFSTAVLVIWGVLTGLAAAVLLLVGGPTGLEALQQASIIAAAPFLIVMNVMCHALFKELRAERLPRPEPGVAPEPERAATRPPGAPAPQQTSPVDPETGR